MGVALGWQRMYTSKPYIAGMAWNDGVSRVGNVVTYSINFCMKLESSTAYWDYVWYVDMEIGSNSSYGRKVKDNTSYHKVIGGREYYQSTFNGNFTGTLTVSGKATTIQLKARFTDSFGNIGPWCYWNVPIPSATSMDDIKSEVSDIDTDSATVSAAITKAGDYSTISSWKIDYGIDSYDENTNTKSVSDLSVDWALSNLTPNSDYRYKITVTSTSGYQKVYEGTFKTLEEAIGYRVTSSSQDELIGWIIYPDGSRNKIKEIRKVNPA